MRVRSYYKRYYEPTPKNIRKWADAIMIASTTAGACSHALNHEWIGVTLMILGVLSKLLSNFFTD